MKSKTLHALCFAALVAAGVVSPVSLLGDPPTPAPLRSHVETDLRLDIDKTTNRVHFISTSNDPNVITKTYVLKNADPYELRPYLRNAITSTRVSDSPVKVEALKYNDGTGVLIVSAEDYKFDKAIQGGGMTIDDIVKKLDLPQITSSSGKGEFIYFPRFAPAAALAAMLRNVGMNVPNDIHENTYGKDFAYVDRDLNAIWFYVSTWSVKHIRSLLALYDQPFPEVRVTYTIYEIDKENDDKIGADWQAWKNGPGRDLFAAASRYASGWDFSQSIPGMPWVNNAHTQFVKFSPRWNTRFLDLISAKGYAKVLTSGVLNLVNRIPGTINVATQYPGFAPGEKYADIQLNTYAQWNNVTLTQTSSGFKITDMYANQFDVSGVDKHGNAISITAATAAGQNITITRNMVGPQFVYYITLDPAAAAATGVQLSAGGQPVGYSTQANSVNIVVIPGATNPVTSVPWRTGHRYTIERDAARDTVVHDLQSPGDQFGFHLRMMPVICGRTTTLTINAYNTSLIGFENNGNPRTERSEISTKLMVANNGCTFVIGGIEKKTAVNSVSKLPWLGSIPGLGWILGTEGANGKSARVVTVLTCMPIGIETQLPNSVRDDIDKVEKAVEGSGDKNNKLGYDQFLIDKDKKKADPLP